MNPPRGLLPPESPEARVRWLHEVGGLEVEDIARRLGLAPERVRKLLEERVIAPVETLETGKLESALAARFGLETAIVAQGDDPIEAVGAQAALALARVLRSRQAPEIIGVAHGRTVRAMVTHLPQMRLAQRQFVSLLGDLSLARAAYPHVVMSDLARITGAQCFPLSAPLYLDTAQEQSLLHGVRYIKEVVDLAARADLWVVGLGGVSAEHQLIRTQMIAPQDAREVVALGAVGEIMGRYFDAQGREVCSALATRTMAPPISALREHRVWALAGGTEKVPALRAALEAGLLRGLITDFSAAERLLQPA